MSSLEAASADQGARSSRALGLLLSVAGVVVLSPDALIIRLVPESPWTILFWRGGLTAVALTLFIALVARGAIWSWFRAIGRIGLIAGFFHGLGSILFVTSVTNTSAANTLVIVSAGPLFAAILSRVFLGERLPLRTWVAIGVVVGAVAVVFSGSLGSGSIGGDLAALGGALSLAAVFTAIRAGRAVNMIPAIVLGTSFTATVAWLLGAQVPGPAGAPLLVVQGGLMMPAAAIFLATAPRHLPAPEVTLIVRLEMVLGPLWVWLVIGEAPTVTAAIGGAVILTALAAHSWLSLRAPGPAG